MTTGEKTTVSDNQGGGSGGGEEEVFFFKICRSRADDRKEISYGRPQVGLLNE